LKEIPRAFKFDNLVLITLLSKITQKRMKLVLRLIRTNSSLELQLIKNGNLSLKFKL